MRLPDFILTHIEPILIEWEAFARSIWPGPPASRYVLRDHAEEMLLAVAKDMKSSQSPARLIDKSNGLDDDSNGQEAKSSAKVDEASNRHARSRLSSGFDLRELVAEYRVLRTRVIQLWVLSAPTPGPYQVEDIIRFNEAIDQLLTESVESFARSVDASRECFLGILGHDLRNPLSAATLISHLLSESPALDSQTLQMAGTLRVSLEAMNLLIRDLLDFTGTRLGAKMVVSPQPMDLLPLCREVIEEMKAAHPAHHFILHVQNDGDTTGNWDAARLRQLLSNLLGNGVQHGFDTTPVTLTVGSTESEVQLAIHNRGEPISSEALSVIFDPMKRHAPTDRVSPAGSIGLGLYIAREVANAHHGLLAVTSSGEETVFTVQLPRRVPADN